MQGWDFDICSGAEWDEWEGGVVHPGYFAGLSGAAFSSLQVVERIGAGKGRQEAYSVGVSTYIRVVRVRNRRGWSPLRFGGGKSTWQVSAE